LSSISISPQFDLNNSNFYHACECGAAYIAALHAERGAASPTGEATLISCFVDQNCRAARQIRVRHIVSEIGGVMTGLLPFCGIGLPRSELAVHSVQG
jgi:hypothetical protein